MEKKCVFCGNKPNKKNKEHVLPQWLLKMTGDPNRVVKFGTNYSTGKEIEFNWGSLTVPSCTKCNEKYGVFESSIKPLINKLITKADISGNEALKILDWLDKVRIGLWINYYYLESNKAQITPRLCIDNRMGQKDRFMQIHFIESKGKSAKGLNAIGVETFPFQFNPSCFGLRINNILIISGSNDFIISENCGFPYPNKIEPQKNGILSLLDWVYNRKSNTKIKGLSLHKGVLTVMQPIHTQIDYQANYFSDSYLIQNCIDVEKRVGTLFRIENKLIQPINDLEEKLKYESVMGQEMKTLGVLISKVYTGQNTFLLRQASEKEDYVKAALEFNKKRIEFYEKTLPNNVYKT